MSDEIVGCICSSLAGLMGAVRDAVTAANGLGSPSDVLPAGGDAAAEAAGGAGGEGGEQQGAAGGLSPTHIASLILLLLAILLSAYRSSPALPAKAHRGPQAPRREDDAEPPVA